MSFRSCISVFHTDSKTGETKQVRIPFDLVKSVKVSHNLMVCNCETIRGRDKTFHCYKDQTKISLSGAFSERIISELINRFTTDSEDSSVIYLNYKNNGNRLKTLQKLFLSFVKDTRLFYIHTRFKTYKNYILTDCSFSDSESVSSIQVDLSFTEVMLRNNEGLYSDNFIQSRNIEIMNFPPLHEEGLRLKVKNIRSSLVLPLTSTLSSGIKTITSSQINAKTISKLDKSQCVQIVNNKEAVEGSVSSQKLWDEFDNIKSSSGLVKANNSRQLKILSLR